MVQILQIHFGYESGMRGLLSKPCEAYPVLIVSNYSAFLMLSSNAQTWCEPYNHTIVPLISRFLGVLLRMKFKIPCILQPLNVHSTKLKKKVNSQYCLHELETGHFDRDTEMEKHHQYPVLLMLFTSIFTTFVLNWHQILYSCCIPDLPADSVQLLYIV